MNVIQNQLKTVTYDMNTSGSGPVADPSVCWKSFGFSGLAGRYDYPHTNDDFEQVRMLYREVLSGDEKTNLISNICASLGICNDHI